MSGMIAIITYGLGTVIGFVAIATLVVWFIQDVSQKKHAVLRNYPVIGRLRYFFERQGEYFRQYFFMNDREEMPFNRSTRSWVYRLAKAEGGVIGFGSTNNTNEAGSILFVNHPYPVLEEDRLPTPPLPIGEGYCREPFLADRWSTSAAGLAPFRAGGAIAVARYVAAAGWTPARAAVAVPHRGGCDIVMQIGTANYGIRVARQFSGAGQELAPRVAFEIKLSQGPTRKGGSCRRPKSPNRSPPSAAFRTSGFH